jgi:hypothetical protein
MFNRFPALSELLKEIDVLEKILEPFPNLTEEDVKLAQVSFFECSVKFKLIV